MPHLHIAFCDINILHLLYIMQQRESRSRGTIIGRYSKGLKGILEKHNWWLNILFENELNDGRLDIKNQEFDERYSIYEYAHLRKSWRSLSYRIDSIIAENKELKERRLTTANDIEFSLYEGKEDETCAVCMDTIYPRNQVYRCSTCRGILHSHCYLFLEDKNKCCLCRGPC